MAPPKGRGRGEDESSPRRITAKEKQARALRLRLHGASYRQIAEEIGYRDESGARTAVQAAMQATIQEPADEYRNMHRQRLEGVLRAYAPGMMAGDWKAGEVYLAALQQLAKLDGLDAPKRVRFEESDMETKVREAARKLGINEDEAVARAAEAWKRLADAT